MPVIPVLCLADSAKHSGRCVAGIRLDTGEWVRPVSPADDGTLTAAMCSLDVGRGVRALDVVEVEVTVPRPEPHQPENWVIGTRQWRLIDELTLKDATPHFEQTRQHGPELLGDRDNSIDFSWIEAHGVESSLAVVRVTAPRFEPNMSNRNRLRAVFALGNAHYDLSITDMAPWVSRVLRQGGVAPGTDWYFTVSLTEPWAKTNRCYKLIASGIEIQTRGVDSHDNRWSRP